MVMRHSSSLDAILQPSSVPRPNVKHKSTFWALGSTIFKVCLGYFGLFPNNLYKPPAAHHKVGDDRRDDQLCGVAEHVERAERQDHALWRRRGRREGRSMAPWAHELRRCGLARNAAGTERMATSADVSMTVPMQPRHNWAQRPGATGANRDS